MANSLFAKGSPEWTTIIATNIVISSGMTANLTPIPKISKIEQKSSANMARTKLTVDPNPIGSGKKGAIVLNFRYLGNPCPINIVNPIPTLITVRLKDIY